MSLESILNNFENALNKYLEELSALDIQECREGYGDQFAELFAEHRKPGEMPASFYERVFVDIISKSPEYQAKVKQMENQESQSEYSDRLIDLYLKNRKSGESLDEFCERCADQYEHFEKIVSALENYGELQDMDLDSLEELEQIEDYGMTDEELNSDDNDDLDL